MRRPICIYGNMSFSSFLEWKIFQRRVQKTKIHILSPVNFSIENRAVYEIMWKIMIKSERPNITDNTGHAHFMLDNWSYRHTLRIFKRLVYCIFMAKVVRRTLLNVKLTVHACLVYYYAQVPVPELKLLTHTRFSRSPTTSSQSK